MNIIVLLINLALINNYLKANPKYIEIKQKIQHYIQQVLNLN